RDRAGDVDGRLELGVGVRRRDLNAEADLAARNEWIGGEGDVDAVLEEESPDRVDVVAVSEWGLDDRKTGVVRGMGAEPVEALEHGRSLLPQVGADRVPALVVHLQACN